MTGYIYQMTKARKVHGNKVIPGDVSMSFFPGAKISMVGPNGADRSSILKIIAGLDELSNDEARLTAGYTVGILEQEPKLDESKIVIKNVRMGAGEIYSKLQRFNEISEEMANPDADFDFLMGETGALQDALDAADAWNIDSQLEQAMDALRCPPAGQPVNVLFGGEHRRVALCKLLIEAPDLLLPNEPMNHLDAESVLWLEKHLSTYAGAITTVIHDRYFPDHVVDWITEIDRGHLYPYEGNYLTYLETKEKRLQVQGQEDAKLAKRLKEELERVRSNPKSRQAKSKARLKRYEEMAAEVEHTRKLDFEEIQIPPGPCLGSVVIEVKDLKKGSGERTLIEGLFFSLPRNGIIGVIGPNGVGKTTPFKTIVGLESLDGGELTIGETVKIPHVDRNRAGIDPDKSLWEVISDGLDFTQVGGVEMPSRAYVPAFGFKGPDQQKPAGVLSGGERNRLNPAPTLKQGGNLLLPDESVNDLDVETLGSLENALLQFLGYAVVVTHDRWFLNRAVTHILAREGTEDNSTQWY